MNEPSPPHLPGAAPAPEDDGPESATGGAGKAVMVKPVANAIRILRYLSQSGQPARAIQIARRLSINSSTCFNILRTLVAEGVVEFSPLSKTYSTGLGLVKLAHDTLTEGQRITAVKPLMQELAARFEVNVALFRRMGPDRIVLAALEHSPTDPRIHMGEGQRLPLLMGASGRAIAAHAGLDKAQLRAMFRILRWQRPLSFEDYWSEMEAAKARGYAIDDGHYTRGILTLATPVANPVTGRVDFSVSAVMFQGQHDDAQIEAIGRALLALSPRLGALLF